MDFNTFFNNYVFLFIMFDSTLT